MVAQFPQSVTNPPKSSTPKIDVLINTFLQSQSRMCVVTIKVENLQKTLAITTFQRIFNYIQISANQDINPVPDVNLSPITAIPDPLAGQPRAQIIFSLDATELVQVCNLELYIQNLRLDYMDEYFSRTLTYLTEAVSSDLNPDI
jgi:hypothetical protein